MVRIFALSVYLLSFVIIIAVYIKNIELRVAAF